MSDNIYSFCDWLTVSAPLKNHPKIYGTTKTESTSTSNIIKENMDFEHITFNDGLFPQHVSVKSLTLSDIIKQHEMAVKRHKLSMPDILERKYGSWILDANDDDKVAIYISGNPTRFFQGHNIWGSSDKTTLIVDYLVTVLKRLKLWESMTGQEQLNVYNLHVLCSRLDLTTNIEAKSELEKMMIMQTLVTQAIAPRENKRTENLETVTFGSNEYNMLSIYDKHKEIMNNMNEKNIHERNCVFRRIRPPIPL